MGAWVVQRPVEVDIGANPSAEFGEDEGVDDQAVKILLTMSTPSVFRLVQYSIHLIMEALLARACMMMEAWCSPTTRREPPSQPSSALLKASRLLI